AVVGASLHEVITAGDPDALAGYYDARAASVNEYCAQLCPPELVDEAVLAAFADFLGRLHTGSPDADLDELLLRSTRTAAASRMDRPAPREQECRWIPELIAARANGEFPHDEQLINKHLDRCRSCRQAAQ